MGYTFVGRAVQLSDSRNIRSLFSFVPPCLALRRFFFQLTLFISVACDFDPVVDCTPSFFFLSVFSDCSVSAISMRAICPTRTIQITVCFSPVHQPCSTDLTWIYEVVKDVNMFDFKVEIQQFMRHYERFNPFHTHHVMFCRKQMCWASRVLAR